MTEQERETLARVTAFLELSLAGDRTGRENADTGDRSTYNELAAAWAVEQLRGMLE